MVTAQEMGKAGGKAKSEAKTAAARNNASKPRGKWVTAIAYQLANVEQYKAFGVVLVNGKGPSAGLAFHHWLCKQVREHGVGLRDVAELEFVNLSSSARMV